MTGLETERLRLRPLVADDAAFVLELVNEPAWLQFIGDRGVRTLEDARGYIATGPAAMQARHGFSLAAVELRADGTPVGICGLIRRDTLPDAELGFALLERHWRNGYAREAAAAVLARADASKQFPRLLAITDPRNERSARLLEKLGFRSERMLRMAEDKPESRLFVRVGPGGEAV